MSWIDNQIQTKFRLQYYYPREGFIGFLMSDRMIARCCVVNKDKATANKVGCWTVSLEALFTVFIYNQFLISNLQYGTFKLPFDCLKVFKPEIQLRVRSLSCSYRDWNAQRFMLWSWIVIFPNSELHNWQSRNFSAGLEVRGEMGLIFTRQAWHLKELGSDSHTVHTRWLSPAFATLCLQRWTLVGIKPALSRAVLPSRCSWALIGCVWGGSRPATEPVPSLIGCGAWCCLVGPVHSGQLTCVDSTHTQRNQTFVIRWKQTQDLIDPLERRLFKTFQILI